ncbi:hypothetical protein L7F22_024798 [Adiantum nelumboides]|nr:hypothetical protein [Adiantum nelumboides]
MSHLKAEARCQGGTKPSVSRKKKPRQKSNDVDHHGRLMEVSVTVSLGGADIDVGLLLSIADFLTNETCASICVVERGGMAFNLQFQMVVRIWSTSLVAVNKKVKEYLGWDKCKPPGSIVLCHALKQHGMHTFQGMVGYCLKDRDQPHFQNVVHNISTDDINQGIELHSLYGADALKNKLQVMGDEVADSHIDEGSEHENVDEHCPLARLYEISSSSSKTPSSSNISRELQEEHLLKSPPVPIRRNSPPNHSHHPANNNSHLANLLRPVLNSPPASYSRNNLRNSKAPSFGKHSEAAKAAKEAFQAHQEAEMAMKKAQTKQMQAQEKAYQASMEMMAQQNLAQQVADKVAHKAAEAQNNRMQEKMEQSAIQHLAGEQLAQKVMATQGAPQGPQPSFAQSGILQAANQAANAANAQLAAAMSAAAAAPQDPASQLAVRAQVESAQQQMATAQQLAAAAQSPADSPHTAMQAAECVTLNGAATQPMQIE